VALEVDLVVIVDLVPTMMMVCSSMLWDKEICGGAGKGLQRGSCVRSLHGMELAGDDKCVFGTREEEVLCAQFFSNQRGQARY
jgi:hypothetical protein